MSDGGAQRKIFGPYFDDNGDIYRGIVILVDDVGTTNAKTYWTDEAKTSAVNNGVLTDSNNDGIVTAFFDGDYRFRVGQTGSTHSAIIDLDVPLDLDSTKSTSDSSTMWEGNFGTTFPTAAAKNKWQQFLRTGASGGFAELGFNFGSAFAVLGDSVAADLETAISDIGSTDITLVISDTQTLTGNLTIPENVLLRFTRNGNITVGSNTLTFAANNPGIQAGRHQIFTVTASSIVSGLTYTMPEWFGAIADDSTDCRASIHHSWDALTNGGLSHFSDPSSSYNISTGCFYPSSQDVADIVDGITFKAESGVVIKNTLVGSGYTKDGFTIGVSDAADVEGGDNAKSSNGRNAILSEKTTVIFADANPDTIVVTDVADLGSFNGAANGFAAGDTIEVNGSLYNDTTADKPYTIASVAADTPVAGQSTITLAGGDKLQVEAAGEEITIQGNATYLKDAHIEGFTFEDVRSGLRIVRVDRFTYDRINVDGEWTITAGNDGADQCYEVHGTNSHRIADTSTAAGQSHGFYRVFGGSMRNCSSKFNPGGAGRPAHFNIHQCENITLDTIEVGNKFTTADGVVFKKSKGCVLENSSVDMGSESGDNNFGVVCNFEGTNNYSNNIVRDTIISNATIGLNVFGQGSLFQSVVTRNCTTDLFMSSGAVINTYDHCNFTGGTYTDEGGDNVRFSDIHLCKGIAEFENKIQVDGVSGVAKTYAPTYTRTTTLTAAQIKDLVGSPIVITGALAGANRWFEFVSATLALNAGTEVLAETADNLVIEYSDGTDASGAIETTGFIDSATDTSRYVVGTITTDQNIDSLVNTSLRLLNTGGDFTGNASNDATLIVTATYRLHETGL